MPPDDHTQQEHIAQRIGAEHRACIGAAFKRASFRQRYRPTRRITLPEKNFRQIGHGHRQPSGQRAQHAPGIGNKCFMVLPAAIGIIARSLAQIIKRHMNEGFAYDHRGWHSDLS
jgi:hypothetical protein